MIAVLDYGLGNTGSILNALAKLGVKAMKTKNPDEIINSSLLIFPGDGAAPQAMENLNKMDLVTPLREYIGSGKPFLGICLGMQILLTFSEEGNVKCLDIIPGEVRRFNNGLKIPQIGWNQVTIQQYNNVTMKSRHEDGIHDAVVPNKSETASGQLFKSIPDKSYFYFINSYYCDPADKSVIYATTDYGLDFCSVFVQRNIIGIQFHPEKSGETGLMLLKNFVNLD